jgi:hypothetical protein
MLVLYFPLKYGSWHIADKMLSYSGGKKLTHYYLARYLSFYELQLLCYLAKLVHFETILLILSRLGTIDCDSQSVA